jgi:hypothetical protein
VGGQPDRKLSELDNPPETYAAERLAAKTLTELKAVLERWKPLALDAWQTAQTMTEADFAEYQRGVDLERKDIFGGEVWYEKYKSICFPAVLFRVSMSAVEHGAPWNYCYDEYVRQGCITVDKEGIARLK